MNEMNKLRNMFVLLKGVYLISVQQTHIREPLNSIIEKLNARQRAFTERS